MFVRQEDNELNLLAPNKIFFLRPAKVGKKFFHQESRMESIEEVKPAWLIESELIAKLPTHEERMAAY